VLFGEMLPLGAFEQATALASESDICFVIGTSAIVYPAALLPQAAAKAGAYLVEVNPEPTPLSSMCADVLRGRAGDLLPFLNQR
jgi:NAD-dependent deacetylase